MRYPRHFTHTLLIAILVLVATGCASNDIPKNPIDRAKAIHILLTDGKDIIGDVRRKVSEDSINDDFDADRNIRQLKVAEEKFHRAKTIDPESFTPPRLLVEAQVLLAMCYLWKSEGALKDIREYENKEQHPPRELVAARDKYRLEMRQYFRRANNEIELYLLGLDRANAWREAYTILATNYELMGEYDKCIQTLERYKRAWRPRGNDLRRVQVSIRHYQELLLDQRDSRAGT